jgi:hypothetical protein
VDWLRDAFRADPHWTTFWCGVALGLLMGLLKFVRDRHKETMMFRVHVRREETEVWPGVKALDAKITGYHEETLRQFGEQGQRIARVESRMPNGELREIKDLLKSALGRNRAR